MSVLLLAIILFFVILLLPFFIAGVSYGKGKPVFLQIRSNNVRDPRFFAKSFRRKIDQALENYDGSGQIQLSKMEELVTPPFFDDKVKGIALLKKPFVDTQPRLYLDEVYCQSSAEFQEDSSFRAIAGRDRVVLGNNSEIIRWVDAEKELVCGCGCELGVSASSGNILRIWDGCNFLRLYAPVICVGMDTQPVFSAPQAEEKELGITRTHKVRTQEVIKTDVISTGKLMIGENSIILGSVKANGDIHVCSGACIIGNLISDGTIAMDEDVFVGGTVFSQYSVYVGRNCQIGRAYQTKSLIAQENIYICEGTRIFGFVSCERGGKTVSYDDYVKLSGKCY